MKTKYSRRYPCTHCGHTGRVSKALRAKFIICPACKETTKANKIEDMKLIRDIVEKANHIRHWHDSAKGGLIVSDEAVRELRAALVVAGVEYGYTSQTDHEPKPTNQ